MAGMVRKSLNSPEETRPFEDGKGKLELVNIESGAVGRATFEPGWQWSKHVKPIAKTDSCQAAHLGYYMSGRMKVVMDDGDKVRSFLDAPEHVHPHPDVLVLDLNLPRVDGITILRHLRTRKPSMPILVLTSRNRVEDRVQCLDLGADDYMGKPFSFAELSARIRALLRRSHLPAASVLAVADLKVDRVERRVERAGKRIELTSKEFGLLEYLMLNAGRRVTRASTTSS